MSVSKQSLHIALPIIIMISIASLFVISYKINHDKIFEEEKDKLLDELTDTDYFSKASYCKVQTIQDWNCGEECTYHPSLTMIQSFYNKTKEAQGYCGYDSSSRQIVVAFRGTDNLKNWISDFTAVPVKFEDCTDCKIHLGFRVILDSISDGIQSCVDNILQSKKTVSQILVTGHSLGGAMATLQAAKLKVIYPQQPNIKLITYGSPRVGNEKFASYMNDLLGNNSYRVVNYRDIVPHVPPQGMGFLHIGQEIWLNNVQSPLEYKVCDSTLGEDRTCSASVLAINYSTKDHTNYFGFYTGCTVDFKSENVEEFGQEIDQNVYGGKNNNNNRYNLISQ